MINMEAGKKYVNLPMEICYLDKKYCMKVADYCRKQGNWKNVSTLQLAKEIYGHAFVFYKWRFLKMTRFSYKMIYIHAEDGIDLANHVDTFQAMWEVLWKIGKNVPFQNANQTE